MLDRDNKTGHPLFDQFNVQSDRFQANKPRLSLNSPWSRQDLYENHSRISCYEPGIAGSGRSKNFHIYLLTEQGGCRYIKIVVYDSVRRGI